MSDKYKVVMHFMDENHSEYCTDEADELMAYNDALSYVIDLINREIAESLCVWMHENYHMEVDRVSDFEFVLTYRDGSYTIYNIEESKD